MRRVCLCLLIAVGGLAPSARVAADDRSAGRGTAPEPVPPNGSTVRSHGALTSADLTESERAALAASAMPRTLPDDPSIGEDDRPHVLSDLDSVDTLSDDATSRPLPFRFEATLQGMLAVPYAGEHGNTALGYAITYGMGYGQLPLLFGLDFMSATSGADANLVVPASASGDAFNVRQASESKTLYFDLWLRVQPLRWLIRPYVEGFVGTKLSQTRYALLRAGAANEEAQTTSAQDWSRSLGWGAGIDFAGLLQLADALSISLGLRRLYSEHVTLTSHALIAGQNVATRGSVAGAVWQFSLGILAWYDLGVPQNDANF